MGNPADQGTPVSANGDHRSPYYDLDAPLCGAVAWKRKGQNRAVVALPRELESSYRARPLFPLQCQPTSESMTLEGMRGRQQDVCRRRSAAQRSGRRNGVIIE